MAGHQTARLAVQRGFARRFGENLFRRVFADDGGFLLIGGERLHQLPAQVLFARQNAQALARTFHGSRRIGSKEAGRALHLAVDDGEILADDDALPRDSPRCRIAEGSPKHREEITFGIALRPFAAFQKLEHFIQAHDADGLDVALLAEAGG